MKIEKIDLKKIEDKSFLKSLNLKYSLEYYYDNVIVKKSFSEISTLNLTEGRYFSEDKELRIYKNNGKYNVTLFIEESSDITLNLEHLVIENKFEDIKKIAVKKYLDYDEDGQAFIKYMRPYKLI